jgi:two-component system, OmpR family, phosphate regulon response regulator OmpR
MTGSPMTEEMSHILVVDDDLRLREVLRKYLVKNGFMVTTAQDAADARAKLESLAFDLIVLDVMMPGESGLELTENLRRESQVPILLLTARGELDDRIAGLEAGADDYMSKPFEPRELVLRIGSILRRVPRPVEPMADLRIGRWTFVPDREELRRGEEIVRLTSAEAALLRVLASQTGSILTREELADRAGIVGNARTVDVQVSRLRSKLEDDPRLPRHLHTVRGEGYVLRPE